MNTDTISDRIALIRAESNLSTREFAEKINVSAGLITNMEKGRRNPSDRTISDICRVFFYNEEWVRTGKGDKFKPIEDKFSTYLSEIEESDDTFIKSFIEMYMELDDISKQVLKDVAKKMANKYK